MKKVLTKFLALSSIGLLMLSACKKDGSLVTTNGGKPGALSASATTLVLDKTKLTDTSKVMTFTFTQPDFGYNAAVTNTLQIDAVGDNWAKPASATIGIKKGVQGYSTADFNTLLLKLNLVGGVTSQVQVRVQHSLGAGSTPIYSNVLSLTVTPFNLTSFLYTVGSFQGWTQNNMDSLISATSNGIYTGVINFTAGNRDFLVVPVRGSYDNKYATNDPVNTTSSTVTVGAPNNFFAPATPGFYIVTLNVNTKTISFAPATEYYSIIGSITPGGDFSTDVDLKYVNNGDATETWEGTFTFPAGTFKFRRSHDWTYSWGIPKAGTDGAGIANTLNDSSNDNIPLDAGKYKITFTLPPGIGNKPSITATYTLVKQ
ncbi:MAG: hypothetical protein JWR09_1364 [Mucilaginibacter sp.]|nr:hypothetical protein [Mucilaginibacter sp.]